MISSLVFITAITGLLMSHAQALLFFGDEEKTLGTRLHFGVHFENRLVMNSAFRYRAWRSDKVSILIRNHPG